MDEEEERRKRIEMVATYLTLPFLLAIPPIVGWYLGSKLDKYFDSSPYAMYILLLLGFIAGVREVYRIIKKYKNENM